MDLRIIRSGEQVVGQLNRVLGGGNLGGVETAVDVDQGLPLPGELPCFLVGQSRRVCQALGNVPVAFDLGEVLGTRYQREVPGTTFRGATDLDQLQSVAGRLELSKVAQ